VPPTARPEPPLPDGAARSHRAAAGRQTRRAGSRREPALSPRDALPLHCVPGNGLQRLAYASTSASSSPNAAGSRHPASLPTILWRPERVKGIPIFREIRFFIPEIPTARFQDHEKPNFDTFYHPSQWPRDWERAAQDTFPNNIRVAVNIWASAAWRTRLTRGVQGPAGQPRHRCIPTTRAALRRCQECMRSRWRVGAFGKCVPLIDRR